MSSLVATVAESRVDLCPSDRRQVASRIAMEMFRQQPDWVTFFREVLGIDGVVQKLFPSPESQLEFEKSEEYSQIQMMVSKLRENGKGSSGSKEPTRVITIRIPKSLHEALRTEAHERRTSINQLCVSKLLRVIDQEIQELE